MPLAQQCAQPLERSLQASFFEIFAEILIEDALADAGGIEELEGLAKANQLVERLGYGREVHGRPLRPSRW